MKYLMAFAVIAVFLAGCCPARKKVVTPVVPEETSETSIATPAAGTPQAPEAVTPTTATPEEKQVALAGGTTPQAAPPEGKEFVEPKGAEALVLKPIYFDFDRYNLLPDARKTLKEIAQYLLDNPKVLAVIEGHCDERGTDEYNLVLGEQRALSARTFLIGMGISPKRLFTVSYGKAKPADMGHNEEAWAKNRRCEFKISKPQ
jgi:peptidoglycan-associated lipoprotein